MTLAPDTSAACSRCGTTHRLEATREAQEAASRLRDELRETLLFGDEGKMLGVLVGTTAEGKSTTLRAFSGMLHGETFAPGFVGPTRSGGLTREEELATLAALQKLSHEIEALDPADLDAEIAARTPDLDLEIARWKRKRKERKLARQQERRALAGAPQDAATIKRLATLDLESGQIRAALKTARRDRREAIRSLEERRRGLLEKRTALRQERRERSRKLQAAMHATHGLVNFRGEFLPVRDFFPAGAVPTGTGECCAPKLLQEAALRGIRPTGLTEFWWGPSPDATPRIAGDSYPPCAEKCAPILGHMLCGQEKPRPAIQVLHEDEDILVVDKPAGLRSTPGRTLEGIDCIETRMQLLRPERNFLRAAHRLDAATSGVLVLALHAGALRRLQADFAARSIQKKYTAMVSNIPAGNEGWIELPLDGDPFDRPRQIVDLVNGSPARTHWELVGRSGAWTELTLQPETGKTHQLRVHLGDPQGLACPIVGDTLYGGTPHHRMLLHARELALTHPGTGAAMVFSSPVPFRA
ncbi:MAG: pseudouridine synthase [Candidatus Binatia bacterium]|nr:pseudouridine synthase [Candidatus Binatia bacterium]MDG2009949.1 pseudouridine synthase [Candidatus Binatia bacterium]